MNAPAVYHGDVIPFADLQKMAAAIAESGLFGMKDTKQALGLMLTAQAEGQHPATITQDYDIIQGKAARKTHSVLARYQQAGGSVEWHALTDTKADATFTPPPSAGKPLRMDWTIDMARKAGLVEKDNWKKYPRAMLRARCIAEGVRATYPGAIGGMLLAEEALDLEPIEGQVTGRTIELPRAKSEPAPASAAAPAIEPSSPAAATASDTGVTEPLLSEGQIRILKARIESAEIKPEQIVKQFGRPLGELPAGKFNDVSVWVREMHEAAR